jgi:predicted alpha/beta-hydrolase family hydrolase
MKMEIFMATTPFNVRGPTTVGNSTGVYMGAPFSVDGDLAVHGRLHAASGPDALVLTHGAGSDHRAPLLAAVAAAFAAEGVSVLRCDLPFRHMRASGPPSPAGAARDRRGLAAALDAVPARGRRFLGGHSYGGRQASMLLAESPHLANGLLLLSYPLHPPGKPERARTAHLSDIRVPVLFVHGERDPFGSIAEIQQARALVSAPTGLVIVPRAGHALPADAGTAREIAAQFLRQISSPRSGEVDEEGGGRRRT